LNNKASYFIAGVSSSVIWGFFSLSLRSIQSYASLDILFYRVLMALAFTAIISLGLRRKQVNEDLLFLREMDVVERRKMMLRILYSSLFVTLNWFSFIYVINHVSIQAGAFAYMVCPILTAVFAFIFLKEELSKLKWIAIAMCFGSILFLSLGFIHEVLYSVFIAVLYAAYLMLQKRIVGLDKLNVLLIQLFISGICVVPFFFTGHISFPTEPHFWIQIAIISAVFTILPLWLSLYALIGMPSATMGILIYINPIVAFLVAIFYFNEGIPMVKLFAYVMLFLAVVLFNYAFLRKLLPGRN
jgi:chloramphenicol-sensitive protein RarD